MVGHAKQRSPITVMVLLTRLLYQTIVDVTKLMLNMRVKMSHKRHLLYRLMPLEM